jgi:hypothetical protein
MQFFFFINQQEFVDTSYARLSQESSRTILFLWKAVAVELLKNERVFNSDSRMQCVIVFMRVTRVCWTLAKRQRDMNANVRCVYLLQL